MRYLVYSEVLTAVVDFVTTWLRKGRSEFGRALSALQPGYKASPRNQSELATCLGSAMIRGKRSGGELRWDWPEKAILELGALLFFGPSVPPWLVASCMTSDTQCL
jgi:hypothetical protein